ncbi:hypothetical protein JXD38_10180 [candidate division WOR-3 bacterium]|nr:hypothetical protein [candidate division WOR-3 bacterium]
MLAVLVFLGTAAVLGTGRAGRDHQQVGLMPEVVCSARRANSILEEIVVRAPRPDRPGVTVARLSGINK